MFFSIIIPTYNPRAYLPNLLTCISRNNCIDDIEIIISDDCSEESFEDILESFKSLHIKTIVNDHHSGFPRDGRQNGADIATGEWICFADQDDGFVDNAFDKIKAYIEKEQIRNYLATDFIKHAEGTDYYEVCDGCKGWTHGKFYEKSFWDKHNLGYDDVKYCEDINLSTKTGCVLIAENLPMNTCKDIYVYIWNRRSDSLSEGDYFCQSMPEYIRGTIGVITDYIEKYRYNEDMLNQYIVKFIQTIYHIYFYAQNDRIQSSRNTILKIEETLYPIYQRFLEATGLTTDEIISKTNTDFIGIYSQTRFDDCQQAPFIEKMTFSDWMHIYLG